jgi:hypothetical protein
VAERKEEAGTAENEEREDTSPGAKRRQRVREEAVARGRAKKINEKRVGIKEWRQDQKEEGKRGEAAVQEDWREEGNKKKVANQRWQGGNRGGRNGEKRIRGSRSGECFPAPPKMWGRGGYGN